MPTGLGTVPVGVWLDGDGRLLERLQSDEFLPLSSRMRVRLWTTGVRASLAWLTSGILC